MADRYRSQDGTRETDEFIEDMPKTPDHQGRSGGEIARNVGTEDSLKRASIQGKPGITRVTKSKEAEDSDEEAGK